MPLNKPPVADVTQLLENKKALIVHFSGAPKGSGKERHKFFPDDLKHVLLGKAQGGVSCSIVMPGDNFHGFKRNATGSIGLVLTLCEPDSLVAVSKHDCGSRELDDGTRIVENPTDITIQDVEDSITQRPPGCYNEWVLRNYDFEGIFAVAPFDYSCIRHLPYPEDMPDWLRSDKPEIVIEETNISEIRTRFFAGSKLPLYTFTNGQIQILQEI